MWRPLFISDDPAEREVHTGLLDHGRLGQVVGTPQTVAHFILLRHVDHENGSFEL